LRSVEEDIKAHIFKAFTNKLFVSYALIETIANWCYINQVLIWQMIIDKIVALKRASFFIRPVKFFCQEKRRYTQYSGGYSLPKIIGRNGSEDCEKPPGGNIDK
jgi:hypothetical protein